MKGVDLFNKAASFYMFNRRSVRWYRKIIFWIVEVALNNSYLNYRDNSEDEFITPLDFRKAIIKEWQDDFLNSKSANKKLSMKKNHIKSDTDCNIINTHSSNRCSYCTDYKKNEGRKTVYMCEVCCVYICPECTFPHFRDRYLS